MNDNKFRELFEKLDMIIGEPSPISPIPVGEEKSSPTLTKHINIERLSSNEVTLFHTISHFLYNKKNVEGLEKEDIEKIHQSLSEKMSSHRYFDNLDKNETD